jgi:CO/xanthine dehydrogenase Mo-binding subunit
VARLIKTEKEVEGRWTEQWIVVEEDVLEQWAEGPLKVVGRPAPRVDGLARARGEARYTSDIVLPGMLHAAILRSPHALARVTRLDADRALAAPGVRALLLPADDEVLTDEPPYHGAPVAAVAADTFSQAQDALELLGAEWDLQEPLLDPDEAVARESFVGDVRRESRGDVERGFAEAEIVVEAEYRTQSVLHNALETHQSICAWEGDGLTVYTSTQWIWGVRDEVADHFGLAKDKVRVVCEYMGGGFGAKGEAGDYTMVAAQLARRTGRPVRCALTRREENVDSGNRNPTVQRLKIGARADGTLTAMRGEYLCSLGWDGWMRGLRAR